MLLPQRRQGVAVLSCEETAGFYLSAYYYLSGREEVRERILRNTCMQLVHFVLVKRSERKLNRTDLIDPELYQAKRLSQMPPPLLHCCPPDFDCLLLEISKLILFKNVYEQDKKQKRNEEAVSEGKCRLEIVVQELI